LFEETTSTNLAAYVVWVPKNGALEEHVPKVTKVVTDPRATHFWDGHQAVMQPYHERYSLTGPCAGIFMIFGPEVVWGNDGPPVPDYAEDAHAEQFDRVLPQFDEERFSQEVVERLEG
jgi:hypothetical protein